MTWTKEVIEQIPAVYRDFMLALRPILDSEDSPVRITGIPRGRIYSILRMKRYEYNLDDIARALKGADLVSEDKFGFFKPTPKGEYLIHDLVGDTTPPIAPPLPPL